jgi:hypothetical protein
MTVELGFPLLFHSFNLCLDQNSNLYFMYIKECIYFKFLSPKIFMNFIENFDYYSKISVQACRVLCIILLFSNAH